MLLLIVAKENDYKAKPSNATNTNPPTSSGIILAIDEKIVTIDGRILTI